MVENVTVAVGIATPCDSVQKLFPLSSFIPGFWPTFELPTSADDRTIRPVSYSGRACRKCGRSHWNRFVSVSVQKLFHFRSLPVSWPTFELPSQADVGNVGSVYSVGMVENEASVESFALFFRSSYFHFRFPLRFRGDI